MAWEEYSLKKAFSSGAVTAEAVTPALNCVIQASKIIFSKPNFDVLP